ncbi:hypothetical protein EPICR_10292 [Candidatus Desulfarcum epimagneticum]|uniref:Uncharacterized protein n=1 Tax=uncultured Desulfobacteraceae bacterium TaxID=218296 RepID=A0A484HBW8_9BACT|nr:hypothetical protein EPICR_10292 [uncultured Desulfobacteraceae bacterium]
MDARDEKLKFNLTNAEAAERRRVTRIQILQGDAACFMSKDPTLLSGELAYERDTGKIKIGNGIDPWNKLPYKVDQPLDEDMANTIREAKDFLSAKGEPGSYAALGPDGKVLRDQLPADLRATTVVRTIGDMEKIPSEDKHEGQFVFVLDASEDKTVGAGGATYIQTPEEKWEKVSEAESMDVDSSDFLLKSKDTLDDILSGSKNVHFTKEDKKKLDSVQDGATDDLSAQEIATMYESIQDVNRLTDDLKKKIESIDPNATFDTPEKIREKLEKLKSSQRLDADSIQPGSENRFFTDKERGEIDRLQTKLETIESGATQDTPEQLRDKLQSLTLDKVLSADYVKDGSTHKFLTPAHLESIKLIGTISKEIDALKNQVGEASHTHPEMDCVTQEQLKELGDRINNFKTEMTNACNQKLSAVQVDVGNNKLTLQNLGDVISRLQGQLGNINESWVRGVLEPRVKELSGNLDSFKTEINKVVNQKVTKLESDLGDNAQKVSKLESDLGGNTQKVAKLESDLSNNAVDLSNLADAIARMQGQLGNISESWVRDISESKIQEVVGGLENFKNQINTALNQRLGKVEVDLANNTVTLDNLGDLIANIQNQLGNINESWVRNISETKIQEMLGDLNTFKTDINKTVNENLYKLESDMGDLALNLRNEFITNMNEKLNSQVGNLETALQSQVDGFRALLTPEQIKVLYESNPDTNVFTDTEKIKLAGIMPNADVTNHESVREAGGVMEGDILFGGDCAAMF